MQIKSQHALTLGLATRAQRGTRAQRQLTGPGLRSGKHKIRAILQASRERVAAAGSLAWAWMDANWQLHGVHATPHGWIQASSHRIAMGANSTESSSGGERRLC